ncbi:hypothetical protein C8R45DRAFT_1165912 [Mycena sanguinolenta]|nr:hypothetical protein C8R45DRAFT_1165912 [Mycena sanguinolenta]
MAKRAMPPPEKSSTRPPAYSSLSGGLGRHFILADYESQSTPLTEDLIIGAGDCANLKSRLPYQRQSSSGLRRDGGRCWFPRDWIQSPAVALLVLPTILDLSRQGPSSCLTVYHSVLLKLQTSLPQVHDQDVVAVSRDDAAVARSRSFVALAERRFRNLDEYNTGALTAPRACEDLDGSSSVVVNVRSHTTAPQHARPTTGATVATVAAVKSFACAEKVLFHNLISAPFVTDDGHAPAEYRTSLKHLSFLRTLLHHELATRKKEIADQHLRFTQSHPPESACILHDFLRASTLILFADLDDEDLRSVFELDMQRATRSKRRIQLHLVKVMDDGDPRVWPFLSHAKRADSVLDFAASSNADTLQKDYRFHEEPYYAAFTTNFRSKSTNICTSTW